MDRCAKLKVGMYLRTRTTLKEQGERKRPCRTRLICPSATMKLEWTYACGY